MKNRKNLILGGCIGLLFILSFVLWFVLRESGDSTFVPKTLEGISQKTKELSIRILKKDDATDVEISRALRFLGELRSDFALDECQRRVEKASMAVKLAIANVLGFYNSEDALEVIEILLKEKNQLIRYNAIVSMSGRNKIDQYMEKLIELEKDSGKLGNLERVALYSSILITTEDSKLREKVLAKLFVDAEAGDSYYSVKAREKLLDIVGFHIKTRQLIKRFIELDKDVPFIGRGILILAKAKDEWLFKRIVKLINHKNIIVGRKSLEALRYICPPNLWDILKKVILNKKNKLLGITALDSLKYYNKKSSVKFLRQLEKKSKNKKLKKRFATYRQNLDFQKVEKHYCEKL